MHITTNGSMILLFHSHHISRQTWRAFSKSWSFRTCKSGKLLHYKFDATLKVDCCRYNISTLEFSVDLTPIWNITTIHCFECYIYADSLEFSIIDVTCEKLTHATHANLESDSKRNMTLFKLLNAIPHRCYHVTWK